MIATLLSWERELLLHVRTDPSRRRAAVEQLHGRHADEVYGFLRRLSGDRQLAEDLLQETFFRVYTHLDRCDPEQSFRGWLYEIARNVAIDALRRRSLEKKPFEKGERAEKSPSGTFDVNERTALTRATLEELPLETRALLLERHGLGLSLPELARSHGCSTRTVTNRLRSAADAFVKALVRRKEGGAK